jgi:hypothetical protein
MQSAGVDARIIGPVSERGMESASLGGGECAMIYDLVERVTATVRRECQVASDEEAKRDIRRMSSMTTRSTPTRCSGVGNDHVLGECDTNYDQVK